MAFSTTDGPDGESSIWLASLDRRSPPRQIARDGDEVSFGTNDELIFRSLAENNALVRIKQDGTGGNRLRRRRCSTSSACRPMVSGSSCSHRGQARRRQRRSPCRPTAVHLAGSVVRAVASPRGPRTGGSSTCSIPPTNARDAATLAHDKTVAIPVPSGKSLPDLPAGGIDLAAPQVAIPGARVIDHDLSRLDRIRRPTSSRGPMCSAISFESRCTELRRSTAHEMCSRPPVLVLFRCIHFAQNRGKPRIRVQRAVLRKVERPEDEGWLALIPRTTRERYRLFMLPCRLGRERKV